MARVLVVGDLSLADSSSKKHIPRLNGAGCGDSVALGAWACAREPERRIMATLHVVTRDTITKV